MSVEFKEKNNKVVSTKAIFFNGVEVGEINEKEDSTPPYRFHAVLKVGAAVRCLSAGLAQGHGGTEVEAIENALRAGEEEVKEHSLGLERLKYLYSLEN